MASSVNIVCLIGCLKECLKERIASHTKPRLERRCVPAIYAMRTALRGKSQQKNR
jgi:hypothetical protein